MSAAVPYDARNAIIAKRDGGVLDDASIAQFIGEYAADRVPDYQAAAMLACVFTRGLNTAELTAWTRAMLDSGERLEIDGLDRPRVDKHSTGGVGDKASLPLAPALAACGAAVPMISGRGLGHTGGTLDKLESIPGFTTELGLARIADCVRETGLVFAAQTPELVPADRKLYALRDATGLVESIPLIASSIQSKKLAENLDALVLDVKYGSGAFIAEPERGAELARAMVDLAAPFGVRCSALQTYMGRPLGRSVGHSNEVRESIDCLRGSGPDDLRELVGALGGEALALAGLAPDANTGTRAILGSLDDGSALAAFTAAVVAQGGDARAVDEPSRLPSVPSVQVVESESAGFLCFADLRDVGRAVAALGGGRLKLGSAIDFAVGIDFRVTEGERVERGQPLLEIHHRDGRGLEEARGLLRRALKTGPESRFADLISGRVD